MRSRSNSPVLRRRMLLAGAAVAAAAWLAAPVAPVQAGGRDPVNALTRHFSSLQVGPGQEFRLLVVHPLFASSVDAAPEEMRLAAGADPSTLGFTAPSGGRTLPLRLDNLVKDRLVVLPGQIVRSDRFDLAFTEPVAVKGRDGTDAPLSVVSGAAPNDEPRPERRILPTWLPPTLRWAIGPEAPEHDLPETLASWLRDAGVEQGRKTAADLARGTVVHERVTDYVRALGTLSRAPAGLQTVGYAAVLDGTPLIIESFADGKLFTTVWPGLIEALATEAAIVEAREDMLEAEIPPSGQPDRFLAPVRLQVLSFFERAPADRRARNTGRILELRTPRGTLRALELDGDAFVHAVLVTDPRRRGTDAEDDWDPGVISRKARPTAAEERWLDRRKNRNPPVPKPPEVPPPK